jgi:hypothetical protein
MPQDNLDVNSELYFLMLTTIVLRLWLLWP